MRSSEHARVHLKLIAGSHLTLPGAAGSSGSPVARIRLGPGAWALMLRGDHTRQPAPFVIRDLLSLLECSDPCPSAERYRITRVRAAALAPSFGPALLHHSSSGTVLHCLADQITAQAAESLAAMAARIAEVVGPAAPGGSRQVSVTRVRHRDLPVDLHPVVTTVRGSQITAHVCSRLITYELAAAMSALGTAYAAFLAPRAATCAPGWGAGTGPLALAGPGAASPA